jgi:hypothetical protein
VVKVVVYNAAVPTFVTGPRVPVARTVVPGFDPLRLRISTVIVPDVPEARPRPTEIFVRLPVTPARNVCPVHVVALKLFVVDRAAGELTWSGASPPRFASFTSPGLEAISVLAPDPVEKSPKFVSVKQLLEPFAVRAKFWTVVMPSLTITPSKEAAG